MNFRTFLTTMAGFVVAAGLLLATPASAQFGAQAAFSEAFQPDFMARDMSLFADALELEDWQKPIVESLLEDYTTEFKSGVDAVREEMKNLKDSIVKEDQRRIMDAVLKPIEAWIKKKEQLKLDFLESVKSQLSDQQLLRWEHFEITFRREKSLPKSEISGENVDLMSILRDMRLEAAIEESLEPQLEQYERELDLALTARDAEVKATQDQITEAMKNMDYDAGLSAMERVMAKRVVIRQVHESHAGILATMLPEGVSADFMTRYKNRAYPKAYRAPLLDNVFEAAKKLEDLKEEQLAAIINLESGYRAEHQLVNDQIANVVKTQEPQEPRRKVEVMQRRKQGDHQKAEDPMRTAIAKRDDLNQRTLEQLKGILTPEQFEKLPRVNFKSSEKRAISKQRKSMLAQNARREAIRAGTRVGSDRSQPKIQSAGLGSAGGGRGRAGDKVNRVHPEDMLNAAGQGADLREAGGAGKGAAGKGKKGKPPVGAGGGAAAH
jgi:hypothetical protein